MPDNGDDAPVLLQLARNRWRIEALDQWRAETDKRIAVLEDLVEGLVKAETLAKALAARTHDERTLRLTVLQKLGAFAIGAASFVAILHGLGAW